MKVSSLHSGLTNIIVIKIRKASVAKIISPIDTPLIPIFLPHQGVEDVAGEEVDDLSYLANALYKCGNNMTCIQGNM